MTVSWIGNSERNNIEIYHGSATGTLTLNSTIQSTLPVFEIAVADLDANGRHDLIVDKFELSSRQSPNHYYLSIFQGISATTIRLKRVDFRKP